MPAPQRDPGRAGDPVAGMERMVAAYGPLARRLARRYASRAHAVEDLEQAACEGLVKAIHRFDPDRGCSFTSFAVPTILGEVRRYCRDMAWPARVPRPVQERVRAVRAAEERLSAAGGRAPGVERLSAELRCDGEDVVEALRAASSRSTLPLDEGLSAAERLGAEDPGYETVECLAAIEEALPALSSLERRVLRLRFGDDLSQVQIAARLGMSRGQVARALESGLERLRAATGAAEDSRRLAA